MSVTDFKINDARRVNNSDFIDEKVINNFAV